MADNKASFLWAIKQQESGGDYNIVNSGSGALGAYQVMPDNVSSWTMQALGHSLSATQFLNDPTAQDRVAETILGGYYDKYGARGAAAMWYSGQPDPNKTYGSPSVADYVKEVTDRMSSAAPVNGTTPTGPNSGVVQAGTADQLANGLSQGLTSSLSAVLGPLFKFTLLGGMVVVGGGLMVLGAFLIVRQGAIVQTLKSASAKTERAEKPQPKTAEPKTAEPKKTPQRKEGTRLQTEKVGFQSESEAVEPKSFGAAHPSYGTPATVSKPPRRPTSKVVRKAPVKKVAKKTAKRVVRVKSKKV